MVYMDLQTRKAQLIRKAKQGSVYADDISAPIIESITEGPDADLILPPTLVANDLGWMTEDGASFSGNQAESVINSWGASEPTRREITTDDTTLAVTAQETNLRTIALYTGNDPAALVPDPITGELSPKKPPRPRLKHFRILALAVDEHEGQEIYIARYLPRATLARNPEQVYTAGDQALSWGFTFSSTMDDEAGYSERYFFGGPGWKALLEEAGFEPATGG